MGKLTSKFGLGAHGGSDGRESACHAGDLSSVHGAGRRKRKMQPTPVFLPGKIPWTEEPGGLQSMGLQKSRTGLSDSHFSFFLAFFTE